MCGHFAGFTSNIEIFAYHLIHQDIIQNRYHHYCHYFCYKIELAKSRQYNHVRLFINNGDEDFREL